MAIVFDTREELEAFCEMFELKSMEETRQNRKFRRKSNHIAQTAELIEPIIEEQEPSLPIQLHSNDALESAEDLSELVIEASGEHSVFLASAS